MHIDIGVLISICVGLVTIAGFLISRSTDASKRGEERGEQRAILLNIQRKIDEISTDVKSTSKTLENHEVRISTLESIAKDKLP